MYGSEKVKQFYSYLLPKGHSAGDILLLSLELSPHKKDQTVYSQTRDINSMLFRCWTDVVYEIKSYTV